MGFKDEQARARVGWEERFTKFGWSYSPYEDAELEALEGRWIQAFVHAGEGKRFREAAHKGYSNRAIWLLKGSKRVDVRTPLTQVSVPPIKLPAIVDFLDVGHSLGSRLVCGETTLEALAPGEDTTLVIVQRKQPIAIYWPHGPRQEVCVVPAPLC